MSSLPEGYVQLNWKYTYLFGDYDSGNYMIFDATTGKIRRFGTFIVWDDLRFTFTTAVQGQSSKPDYDFTNLGLLFPPNDDTEIANMIGQMPHEWQEGSSVYPHIHMIQSEETLPTFKLDYKIYNVGADVPAAWTTITLDQPIGSPYTGNDMHQILSAENPIDMTGKTLSCKLDLKLYRDDNDVTGDILAKEFDIHYAIDSEGSDLEYIKY